MKKTVREDLSIDNSWSGVNFARPAFMEFMELAEQGKVGTLIVKDHSRLGRNRLVVGQLLEEDFDRLSVRYIAVMDNIDTAKGLSDLVPMQDESLLVVIDNSYHYDIPNTSIFHTLSGGMLTWQLLAKDVEKH